MTKVAPEPCTTAHDDSETLAADSLPSPTSRNALRTHPILWHHVCVIFLASSIPTALAVSFFSLMGFGLEFFNRIAEAETNSMGNGIVLLAVIWICLLFVFDADKSSPLLAAPLYGSLMLMAFSAAFLKGILYPWGTPLLVLMLCPFWILKLRTLPSWTLVRRGAFYRTVGFSTLAVSGLLIVVWLVWTYTTNYSSDGAAWTVRTKASVINDTKSVYDHVFPPRPLVYDSDCGPAKVDVLDEKERGKIKWACNTAATVWFVIWMVPLGAVIFNLLVTSFCLLESRVSLARGKEVVRLLQVFMSLLVFVMTGMYVSIYASGVSVYLASAFMAVFGAAILALVIWANHEIDPEVLAEAAKESSFAKNMAKAFKSDWVRALGLGSTNVLIPSLLLLDMLRQTLRKVKGTATDRSKRFTQIGQTFVDGVHAWNWNQIFTKLCIVGEIFALLVLGGKFTYVFFSWLNYDVLDGLSLAIVTIFVFFVGVAMFMLPIVPGSAVYLFAGIVVGKQSQSEGSIGFWPGVALGSVLGLVAKLSACCGQYSIGHKLGESVAIQKMIGVDTVPTRALEKIVKQKGFALDKVAILVGGPDWPTSVTCGILRLNIPQMLLGTLPVYIASIAPQTLVGALITKDNDGSETLWSTLTTACTGVAAVCQAGACLVASRSIIQTVEKDGAELAKPRPEHAKVAELTAKQADYVKAFSEIEAWSGMSVPHRGRIAAAAYMQLLAFFLFAADFVLMEPVCFKKFAVNDRIRETLNGNVFKIVLLPLGAASIAICLVGCVMHIVHLKSMARLARERLSDSKIG